jgi:hypothetical protein
VLPTPDEANRVVNSGSKDAKATLKATLLEAARSAGLRFHTDDPIHTVWIPDPRKAGQFTPYPMDYVDQLNEPTRLELLGKVTSETTMTFQSPSLRDMYRIVSGVT